MKTTYEIFSENLRNQLMAHNRSQAKDVSIFKPNQMSEMWRKGRWRIRW